ncbi:hypothetical protein PWT90_09556 [Aphanocladium album]|nr:hypothetical protein PWT90_09556 [Aphanocladium album]
MQDSGEMPPPQPDHTSSTSTSASVPRLHVHHQAAHRSQNRGHAAHRRLRAAHHKDGLGLLPCRLLHHHPAELLVACQVRHLSQFACVDLVFKFSQVNLGCVPDHDPPRFARHPGDAFANGNHDDPLEEASRAEHPIDGQSLDPHAARVALHPVEALEVAAAAVYAAARACLRPVDTRNRDPFAATRSVSLQMRHALILRSVSHGIPAATSGVVSIQKDAEPTRRPPTVVSSCAPSTADCNTAIASAMSHTATPPDACTCRATPCRDRRYRRSRGAAAKARQRYASTSVQTPTAAAREDVASKPAPVQLDAVCAAANHSSQNKAHAANVACTAMRSHKTLAIWCLAHSGTKFLNVPSAMHGRSIRLDWEPLPLMELNSFCEVRTPLVEFRLKHALFGPVENNKAVQFAMNIQRHRKEHKPEQVMIDLITIF